jgi:hypothetical protein
MSRPALSGGSCSWGAWQPLPARLRILPLALFALIVPSYVLRGYFETVFGNPVMAGSQPRARQAGVRPLGA